MHKNTFIAFAIAAILIVGASQPVQALTADEVQAQIKVLLQKVTELTQQLNQLRGSQGILNSFSNPSTSVASPAMPSISHRLCALSMRAFKEGNEGDDVRAFQEFLQSEGYFSITPTGYYGPITSQALARWQVAQGFESAGVIGPKTMERIRVKCGFGGGNDTNSGRLNASPSQGSAPLTVTFSHYVGGFRPAGISYVLDFGDGSSERATECPAPTDACTGPGTNTHTYRSDGTYTATLSKVTDPCFGQTACRAAIHSEVIGKAQIYVGSGGVGCTGEYKPVCGAKQVVCITYPCNPVPTTYGNRCEMSVAGASFLYEGQCRTGDDPANDSRCKAWYDGCNTCSRSGPGEPAMCTLRACMSDMMAKPYCTAYFDSSANKPPVISGLSGPTTLNVNVSGTWTVYASDPENQTLSYRISWGDELAQATPSVAYAQDSFVQTTTFSHSYARAGTYTIIIVVRDGGGQEAKTSTTVKVGGDVACTMQYNPVCGRPAGCANTCPSGQYCAAICQLHQPQTYSNKCYLSAASAQFLHEGQCTANSGNIY